MVTRSGKRKYIKISLKLTRVYILVLSQSQLFDGKAQQSVRAEDSEVESYGIANVSDPNDSRTLDDLLEWTKKDKRRLLHAVYRVGNLDKTIKYVSFCR